MYVIFAGTYRGVTGGDVSADSCGQFLLGSSFGHSVLSEHSLGEHVVCLSILMPAVSGLELGCVTPLLLFLLYAGDI